jgi:carboxyl-terminal processing protease
LVVLDVEPESPASKAGIKRGLFIKKIAGRSTTQLNELEALALLRGPLGSRVKVEIVGRSYNLKMANEPKKNLIVNPMKNGIAHLHILNFRSGTGRRVAHVMRKLNAHYKGKIKGLVIDLRGNPGGLVTEGTKVTGLFVKAGKIVSVVSKKHMRIEVEKNPTDGPFRNVPMVVLIDGRSASVSEIFAMAIRDYGRAKLVGQKTLGKGTVQVIIELMDGSALKLSTGRYYSPKWIPIYDGIEPDLVVDNKEYDGDTQLRKAIELLTR